MKSPSDCEWCCCAYFFPCSTSTYDMYYIVPYSCHLYFYNPFLSDGICDYKCVSFMLSTCDGKRRKYVVEENTRTTLLISLLLLLLFQRKNWRQWFSLRSLSDSRHNSRQELQTTTQPLFQSRNNRSWKRNENEFNAWVSWSHLDFSDVNTKCLPDFLKKR